MKISHSKEITVKCILEIKVLVTKRKIYEFRQGTIINYLLMYSVHIVLHVILYFVSIIWTLPSKISNSTYVGKSHEAASLCITSKMYLSVEFLLHGFRKIVVPKIQGEWD